MSGENKPLNYVLKQRKITMGPNKNKMAFQAYPARREVVTYRRFCERVARATTFTAQEVMATLNLAAEVARDIVANGDAVQYGDLGTLAPSFKSKTAMTEKEFTVATHITKPVVKLSPSRKYFTLTDVRYQRVAEEKKDETVSPTPDPDSGGGGQEEEGGGGQEGGGGL